MKATTLTYASILALIIILSACSDISAGKAVAQEKRNTLERRTATDQATKLCESIKAQVMTEVSKKTFDCTTNLAQIESVRRNAQQYPPCRDSLRAIEQKVSCSCNKVYQDSTKKVQAAAKSGSPCAAALTPRRLLKSAGCLGEESAMSSWLSKFCDAKIKNTVAKTAIQQGESFEVVVTLENPGDIPISGKLAYSPPDAFAMPGQVQEGVAIMGNLKTDDLTIPPKSSTVMKYNLVLDSAYRGSEIWLGEAVFTYEFGKLIAQPLKVQVVRRQGLVADPCNYDYTCGPRENYNNCLNDCASGYQDSYCDGLKDRRCDPDCNPSQDTDCGNAITGKLFGGQVDSLPQGKPGISKSQAGLQNTQVASPVSSPRNTQPETSSPPPAFPNCGNKVCDPDENCVVCSNDCVCPYGKAGPNQNSACGWYEDEECIGVGVFEDCDYKIKLITKNGNLQIEDTLSQKTIRDWVFSNSELYHEVVNERKFDRAMREIAKGVNKLFNNGANYALTNCYDYAPASSNQLLSGGKGLCSDWASLQVTLLRTLDVPAERVYKNCYPTSKGPWHCTTVYISDAGIPLVIDYGQIYPSFQDIPYAKCANNEKNQMFNFWENDQGYDFGLRVIDCYYTPAVNNEITR